MKYSELFPEANLDASLTTVEVVDGVIKEDCWFGFAMTVAPGVPISSLVEGDDPKLGQDTLFRATLHRCLDLFVYKFFINIVQHGFYHGDPHAGNIYFSYKDRQLTLIDFGAVGRINIYEDNPVNRKLVDVVISAVFGNFTHILDIITDLVNSKCPENSFIDINSMEYQNFRKELEKYQIENIINRSQSAETGNKYKEFFNSPERIRAETADKEPKPVKYTYYEPEDPHNPYSYLDLNKFLAIKFKEDKIRDNTSALPFDFKQEEKNKVVSHGFGEVLAKITEFYAGSGVNIAIKFAQFYELLKAYVLLLGVLNQTNYPSERMGVVMGKLLHDRGNLYQLKHIKAVYYMFQAYRAQKREYDEMVAKFTQSQSIYQEAATGIGKKYKLVVPR